MRRFGYIIILLFFACNSEEANDCFQTSGATVQQEVSVLGFEKILVNRNIELILKDAPQHKVVIETGENLINDITVEVIDDRLILTDNNHCNFIREYGSTKIYIDAPNISEIRSSTQFKIASNGVLNYSKLVLFSEDYNGVGDFTTGDFVLSVNAEDLTVISNNLSFYYLNGEVENLFVGFYSGLGRFEGENLVAQNVNIYHRGGNDIIVNPQISLNGELKGAGNLIALNVPSIVNVEQFYTGQLIFN
ncbi:MAG: DUF2807 domain-containing protein [Winogradskyella sp.]|uniref:head GIN domain-containing protein n=1 Tax=Winogradskyella sp. TaxID=1883156 RepID=UPI001828157B|nr:DUF2807 domain-containing protein [Winogradskyella sp.]